MMETVIYEYKMSIANLMDYVLSEQVRKIYHPDAETNAASHHMMDMTEDDILWFRKYLSVGLGEICTKLQPLQKYLDKPYNVDELMVTLRFRLSPLYMTDMLENTIMEAVANYICYRWFMMKSDISNASVYKSLYDENLSSLKGYGARGIYGRSTCIRPYDIGLGCQQPQQYQTLDVIIKDIEWGTSSTYFSDIYGKETFRHDEGTPSERKENDIPGISVEGNTFKDYTRGVCTCIGEEDGDRYSVSDPTVPSDETITRDMNEINDI